ncbi:hypothetical protein ACA29_05175 [Lederbergia galactosidilytica]|uniref:Uncharacterized protein n=1 Tax=Lederbergia galactosidilytica TaxID=217031 RepID=A0A0Q9YD49_9BACI|nr:hypothetical protein ACA29_05175 [Lederbergia galactosidilytica]
MQWKLIKRITVEQKDNQRRNISNPKLEIFPQILISSKLAKNMLDERNNDILYDRVREWFYIT